jgi:hypothetical protein
MYPLIYDKHMIFSADLIDIELEAWSVDCPGVCVYVVPRAASQIVEEKICASMKSLTLESW